MNNSLIATQLVKLELEEAVDNTVTLREQASEMERIVNALEKVASSPEWKFLQEKIFDGVPEILKRQREIEIEKMPINGPKVHNLNGQLAWAKKYSNLASFANIYKQRLSDIRKQLNGNARNSSSS